MPPRARRCRRPADGDAPWRASTRPDGWARWSPTGCPSTRITSCAPFRPAVCASSRSRSLAAEHAGGARWCLETATEYAKVRRQFGRPIGQFQAVKHRLADMAVRVEQLAAVAGTQRSPSTPATVKRPTSRPRRLRSSRSTATRRARRSASRCSAGIGFTWEHDAHLYLKRAMADRQLLGDPDSLCLEVTDARRWRDPAHSHRRAARPGGPSPTRAGAGRRDAAGDARGRPPARDGRSGTGRAPLAASVGARRRRGGAGGDRRALRGRRGSPVRISGSGPGRCRRSSRAARREQHERWVRPTLLGELSWCQLFSEPGAGSDLAGLSTRAERGQDGWLLTGQKVWTSMARQADWGICLARTDPDAPKHRGITYFIVDMHSDGSRHPAPA